MPSFAHWSVTAIACVVVCLDGVTVSADQKTDLGVPITSISMLRGECFWGTCPSYAVSITSAGTVAFVGLASVRRFGAATKGVSPAAFEKVAALVEDNKFFLLANSYGSTRTDCKEYWSDSATVTFVVVRGSTSKSVFWYLGCKVPGITDKLQQLAVAIDEAAGTGEWLDANKK